MGKDRKYDFGFSVDEIYLDEKSRSKFGVRLIPDYNSNISLHITRELFMYHPNIYQRNSIQRLVVKMRI